MNFERMPSGISDVDKNIFKGEVSCLMDNMREDDCNDTYANFISEKKPESELKNKLNAFLKNIEHHAVNKNFLKAESIRHALYLAAPNAIMEIYESGKIIEKEKNKLHFDRLKKVLNEKEYSTLITSLKTITFQKKTTIIKKGKKSANVFLVNEGLLNIMGADQSSVALKPGSVLGVGSFFEGHAAKESIIVSAGTNADYLTESDFKKLVNTFPGLKKKLYKFAFDSVNELNYMDQYDYERRAHTRYRTGGFVNARMMNSSMKPSGDLIRGAFIDISNGGLSFRFKNNQGDPGKILKGKTASIVLEPAGIKSKKALTWDGQITDVRELGDSEYSVHFKGEIKKKSISGLVSLLKQKQN